MGENNRQDSSRKLVGLLLSQLAPGAAGCIGESDASTSSSRSARGLSEVVESRHPLAGDEHVERGADGGYEITIL